MNSRKIILAKNPKLANSRNSRKFLPKIPLKYTKPLQFILYVEDYVLASLNINTMNNNNSDVYKKLFCSP